MSTQPSFSGFPPEGIQFLEELPNNNNRDWFEAHREVYQTGLVKPAQAFVIALGERLKTLFEGITYDPRTNGSGSLLRIHRDVRFSADKSPYKTNLGIIFWQGKRRRTENPGFFFHLDAYNGVMYAGIHVFPKPLLEVYRHAVIDDHLGSELIAAIDAVQHAGDYAVGGTHYKRIPRGYDATHARADLLYHNGLYATSPHIPREVVMQPDLLEVCFTHCCNMLPLHQWLVKMFTWSRAEKL
jgi:uncharacterized protein (TIGR02453 family)